MKATWLQDWYRSACSVKSFQHSASLVPCVIALWNETEIVTSCPGPVLFQLSPVVEAQQSQGQCRNQKKTSDILTSSDLWKLRSHLCDFALSLILVHKTTSLLWLNETIPQTVLTSTNGSSNYAPGMVRGTRILQPIGCWAVLGFRLFSSLSRMEPVQVSLENTTCAHFHTETEDSLKSRNDENHRKPFRHNMK